MKPACLQRRVVPLQCHSCHDNLFCKHLSYPIKCLTVTAREGFPQQQKKKRSCPLLVSPLLLSAKPLKAGGRPRACPPQPCLTFRLPVVPSWSSEVASEPAFHFGSKRGPPTHGCGRNNGGGVVAPFLFFFFCCGGWFGIVVASMDQQSVGVVKDEDE